MSPHPPTSVQSTSCASSPSSVSYSILSTLSNISSATRLSSTSSSASQPPPKGARTQPLSDSSSTQASSNPMIIQYQHGHHFVQQQQQHQSPSTRKVRIDAGPTIIGGSRDASTASTAAASSPVIPNQHTHHQQHLQYSPYPINLYANGYLMSAAMADYDQHSSSSNSSASFTARSQTTAKTNNTRISKSGTPGGNSATKNNTLTVTPTARYLKPQALDSASPDSSQAENSPSKKSETNEKHASVKSNKPKSSPRHLLYEVLLSPIKRKVMNCNNKSHFGLLISMQIRCDYTLFAFGINFSF